MRNLSPFLQRQTTRRGLLGLCLPWILGAAYLLFSISLCSAAGSSEKKNPYTGNAAAIEEGRHLYHQLACPACHGDNAEGAVGPSLNDDQWRYIPTDQTLFDTISNGRQGTLMPPWKGTLTAEQIWKLIAYIRSIYRGDPKNVVW
jgi:cytochrome c(L)